MAAGRSEDRPVSAVDVFRSCAVASLRHPLAHAPLLPLHIDPPPLPPLPSPTPAPGAALEALQAFFQVLVGSGAKATSAESLLEQLRAAGTGEACLAGVAPAACTPACLHQLLLQKDHTGADTGW